MVHLGMYNISCILTVKTEFNCVIHFVCLHWCFKIISWTYTTKMLDMNYYHTAKGS